MGSLGRPHFTTPRDWIAPLARFVVLVAVLAGSACATTFGQLTDDNVAETGAPQSVSVRFMADPAHQLSETDVISLPEDRWIDSPANGVTTFGYSKSAVWCQIRITAPADEAMVVELPTTRLDHVHWFLVVDDKPVALSRNGFRDTADAAFAPRNYPTVHLPRTASGRYELFFRTTSECSLAIPVTVTTAAQLQAVELSRCARSHLEIGMAFAIVVVCITLSVLFKDVSLAILGVCGTSVICYGISFDTVLSLRGYQVPLWLPRTGCTVFCALQALTMLGFTVSEAGLRNLSRVDRLVLVAGGASGLCYMFLHIWIPYAALIPWLNTVCIVDSACSVWIISVRYRSDRQFRDLFPILMLMLAHLPGLLLVIYFQGFSTSVVSPQSLRMIAMPIVFCGMAFSLLQRRRVADNLRLNAALAQVGESDARLMALRYQLNPHMLMNSLTAISSLSRRCPEQIPALIQNLSMILHARLKPASDFCWTLQQELKLARSLIAVEQVRFDGQLTVFEHIAVDTLDCTVPEMLLQPLIENSFKYCSSCSGSPELRLDAWLVNSMLHIRVSNSVDTATVVKPAGGLRIGHANIRERLDLTYGGRAKFEFQIRDSVSCAEVSIPARLTEAG